MKKFLIWFCGTSTSKENMIKGIYDPHGLKLIDTSQFDEFLIIDGVGSMSGTESSIFSSNKKPFLGKALRNISDQIWGYREDVHIQHDIEIFNMLKPLEDSDDDIELTISGHSRGAAVGMVSFLIQLSKFSESTNELENSWKKVKNLRIIPVDPVSGKQEGTEQKNNLQGAERNYDISDIISGLSDTIFSQANIEVIVFSARFDARKDFKFDGKWKELIDEFVINKNPNARFSTSLVTAGFRHSAMVCVDDEISQIYGEELEYFRDLSSAAYQQTLITPIKLLKSIIENRDGWRSLQYSLASKELKIMYKLLAGEKNQSTETLRNNTTVSSFGIIHWFSSLFNRQAICGEMNLGSHICKKDLDELNDEKLVFDRYILNF